MATVSNRGERSGAVTDMRISFYRVIAKYRVSGKCGKIFEERGDLRSRSAFIVGAAHAMTFGDRPQRSNDIAKNRRRSRRAARPRTAKEERPGGDGIHA